MINPHNHQSPVHQELRHNIHRTNADVKPDHNQKYDKRDWSTGCNRRGISTTLVLPGDYGSSYDSFPRHIFCSPPPALSEQTETVVLAPTLPTPPPPCSRACVSVHGFTCWLTSHWKFQQTACCRYVCLIDELLSYCTLLLAEVLWHIIFILTS